MGRAGLWVPSPDHSPLPNRWEMQVQVQPEAQVSRIPSVYLPRAGQTPSRGETLQKGPVARLCPGDSRH